MIYKPIGDFIQKVSNKNRDLRVTNLLGVNIQKSFMPSVANQLGLDLSKYKIITKGQFAMNLMHVNRDEVLPVALYNNDEDAIVSPAYVTFEVINEEHLFPEFLMIEFLRSEFDRRTWTYCDSSVRGGLEYERFCEIKIPIPNIDEQKKYVNIYKSIITNQNTYDKGLDDLQMICDLYIDKLIKTEKKKVLGEYIEKLNEINSDNLINDVMGMSTQKKFRKPNSRVNKNQLSKYRIVKNGEFVFVPTTDTWRCLAVALSSFKHPIVVSTIYVAFKVKSKKKLLPEFLYLFLKRQEFDRYARFHSWGSARETFDWDDMCQVILPIPSIEKQEAIINIYHSLEKRKKIRDKLDESIKPLASVMMRGVTENNEIC